MPMPTTCHCGGELVAAGTTTEGPTLRCSSCSCLHVAVPDGQAFPTPAMLPAPAPVERAPGIIPGVTRLSALADRIAVVEAQLAVVLRFVDPTSPQLSRQDRDALVAYAEQARSD